MILPSTLVLAGHAAAAASSIGTTALDAQGAPANVATSAFILECQSSQNLDPVVKAVEAQGGEIGRQFDSKVFYGVSVRLHNSTLTTNQMENMPGVTKVWPIEAEKQQVELQPVQSPGQRSGPQRRDTSSSWNHIMTQIDKLHAAGFTGSGIKIGIVDTGVSLSSAYDREKKKMRKGDFLADTVIQLNYTHPAFGGCFGGDNCRVVAGDNFSKDGNKGDPMDCHGHGTAVAGILAGNDANFIGAAPNATLAAYRVTDCDSRLKPEDLMAGWLQAYKDGAQIIISSTGWQGSSWDSHPVAAAVARIVDDGVPCIVGVGNAKDAGLFSALTPSSGKGVTAVNAFARAPGAIDGPVRDAPMAKFSTYGPNWDLSIKPSVSAPGDDVPTVNIRGEYENVSGTSFAGPLVGGIMALMAEVRGSFDPALLNSLLMSTAVPQGAPFSVAQQGGGLVRAWDAAHATTLVEPAGLAFNDTLHREQSLRLRITNTAKSNVTYHLDTVAAETLYTLQYGSNDLKQSPPEKKAADIKLSQRVLVLGPDQSAFVDISAADPEGLDPSRLPVWSGWISISSSSSANSSSSSGLLTVPYLGLSGSLKEHQVLKPDGAALSTRPFGPDVEYDSRLSDGQNFSYKINEGGSLDLELPMGIKPRLGTRLARAEAVPVSPRKWLAERLKAKDLKLKAFTIESLSHSESTRKTWNGQLESGDYVPVGTYKLAVRALRLFGDANVESDWDLSETVTFNVGGGGAHEDKTLEEGLKSPFMSWDDCVRGHETLSTTPSYQWRKQDCMDTKDESTCGTDTWCSLGFGTQKDNILFNSPEECKWAHGIY
ncbi:Thermophilic serine proteinase [Beauveria bassiana]|uniref:Thermophilic serine proteinase n=1 Tax=Beauveria bassiana TaxID=176275 RepID=A0A2N6NDP0_BEABA|nr:Thermophilic serine proteinase [Beauveria bassiana]